MAPTPDMAVKSWLHGVSFDIIRSTNRLQQCYHDDPLLRIPSNFIYTCVPNTNAPYLKNLRQQWCYHTRYGGREIASRPATAHNRDTSSSVASPSRLLTLAERFNHRLHMYTKHKCVMFEELGPSWRHHTWYVYWELTSRPSTGHHQDTSSSVASTP